MDVKAWDNGKGSFGISIDKKDRDAFFKKTWKIVRISFQGGGPETFEIKGSSKTKEPAFWKEEKPCVEIRNVRIREWLRHLGYVRDNNTRNWKGKRPKLKLTPLDNDGSFDLVP